MFPVLNPLSQDDLPIRTCIVDGVINPHDILCLV